MKPSTIICVDDEKAALAEDGFYIHREGSILTLRLAAVALFGENVLLMDSIRRTLGKGSDEIHSLGNPRMCKERIAYQLNFRHDGIVPSVVVDININTVTKWVSASVYLDFVKAFKHYTHSQAEPFLQSHLPGTFSQVDTFLNELRSLGYAETDKGWDDRITFSRGENFVRRLLWLFNSCCATVAHTNHVPVIGKKEKRTHELVVSRTNLPIFNCPVRHPVAAINNYNLVHFLEHGKPYFTENDLQLLLQKV